MSVAFSAEVQIRGPKTSKNTPNPNVTNKRDNLNNRGYVDNSDGSITLLLDNAGATYGPITSDDTLWQIASRYTGNRNLSVYQAMYAIYQRNPNAFEQDNLNLLKNGFVLELPTESDVARINKADAQMRFERDKQRLLEIKPDSAVRANNPSSALTPAQNMASASSNVSKDELAETKQLIEQKLGALDEAQTRHFMAIRQQFAESINNVQAILTENQKLAERLDKVNADIDQMREQETLKTQQMTQMGQSIEELLNKSREQEQATVVENNQSWLDSPLLLIGATSMLSLSVLGGFAYWLVRRKTAEQSKELHIIEDDDIELDSHNSALDDLSDALSNELSDELGEELDDDNLFGDEDLLDDVLAEELGESLDEALDESVETELEHFDDLGDELLDSDALSEEFEAGTGQIDQSDLDDLFDEDDEITDADTGDTDLAPERVANEKNKEPVESTQAEQSETLGDEASANLIKKVGDEDEPPEISIEELFDSQDIKLPESIESDNEEINEEMLQQLDKEIATQNAELDNITGNLLDELEQVEQMRDLMGDFMDGDDDEPDERKDEQIVQPSIKKLDEDSLAEGFDAGAGFEPDFLDVLDEDSDDELVPLLSGADAVKGDIDDAQESNNQQNTIEQVKEPEPEIAAEPDIEPEPAVDPRAEAEPDIEPEPAVQPIAEAEPGIEPEPELEPLAAAEPEIEPEPELEPRAESEPDIEPEPAVEPLAEAEPDIEPEPELEPLAAAEPDIEAEPAVEPLAEVEPDIEAEPAVEPLAESEPDIEPEPAVELLAEAEPDIQPEPAVEPLAEAEPELEPEELDVADDDYDETEDIRSEQQLEAHANNDHGLDEDQLEKALEDFEHQELDAVLEDLTSNKSSALDTLDDLEFGMVAEDFVQHKSSQPKAQNIQSDEPDDALLEKALAELDAQTEDSVLDSDDDDLDDLPGLGDWLSEAPKASSPASQKSTDKAYRSEDESLLDELEEANFDELLSAMDLDEEPQDSEFDGLNIGALLSEQEVNPAVVDNSQLDEQEDDFLDVEALLNDSFDDENESSAEKELDLSSPLAAFFGDNQPDQTVDVDSDSGVGAKLDLAHAYIEIGENESAIELLEDIIDSGNEQQKAEAQNILNSLSAL